MQLEVLGGDHVHRLDCGLAVRADGDQAVVVKRRHGDIRARGVLHVALDGCLNLVGVFLGEGDEVAGGQGVVLGLGHKVDGDERGICRFISDDAHLGGACDHVDSHIARHDLLRGSDVGVAGAGNLGNRLDGLGAVGKSADSLGAADRVDLGHAGDLAGGEDSGIERAVLGRGRHAGDALDACDRCGDGVHEHGGRIERASAGNIDAYGFERRHLRADDCPVLARGDPALLLLALMELANLLGRMLERGDRLCVALGCGGIDRLLRHAEVFHLDAVELGGKVAQRRITALAHLLDDRGCRGDGARVERSRAVDLRAFELLAFLQNDSTHDVFPSYIETSQ